MLAFGAFAAAASFFAIAGWPGVDDLGVVAAFRAEHAASVQLRPNRLGYQEDRSHRGG